MENITFSTLIHCKNASPDELKAICIMAGYEDIKLLNPQIPMLYFYDYIDENELDSLYIILKKIFGKTHIEFIDRTEYSIVDQIEEIKISYNENNNNKKIKTTCYCCYGTNTSNEKNIYVLLKDEIEASAKTQGININWNEEYEPDPYDEAFGPETDEFYDFCQNYIEEKGGLEKISTNIEFETKLKDLELKHDFIKHILNTFEINSNIEQKIEINFKNIIDKLFEYKNYNKKQLMEYIKQLSLTSKYIQSKYINLKYVAKELLDDEEVIYIIVKNCNYVYHFENIPENFKDDPKIMYEAIQKNYHHFKYASNRLKNDKKFILEILNSRNHYQFASHEKEFIYKNLSTSLKKDKEIKKQIKN